MLKTIIFIADCALSMGTIANGRGHSSGDKSGGVHANFSSHTVRGHTTKNGTHVAPSHAMRGSAPSFSRRH
jgi:hypothetical protein